VDRVLERRDLTRREEALWGLVHSSCDNDLARRHQIALAATAVLTPDEVYLATMVIALFQFYNAFVDLNGVARGVRGVRRALVDARLRSAAALIGPCHALAARVRRSPTAAPRSAMT
jgi:hypothetical protein